MYHEVKQEVKDCEACRNNAKNQAPEPPAEKHEFAERPMQKMSSDIFHFGSQNYLILVDWYSGFSFTKRLGRTSGTEQVIHKMKIIFLQYARVVISMIFAIQDGRSLLTFISQQVTF